MAGPLDEALRWWNNYQASRRAAHGLDADPLSPEAEAFARSQDQPGQLAPPAVEAPTPGGPGGPGETPTPPATTTPATPGPDARALPYPSDTTNDLYRMENRRKQLDNDLQEGYAARAKAGAARAAASTPGERERANTAYDAVNKAVQEIEAAMAAQDVRISAEKNRIRDDEKTKKAQPENGQTRTVPWEEKLPNGQTIRGIKTEVYKNGIWDYVAGSSRREEGARPEGVAQITNQVLTDGRGAYWTYDTATGKATPINGPAAGVKTINDPDGSVWTQNADGSKGTKLFDSLPQTYTDNGIVIGVDKRTGREVFRVDTKTPEGRELANRLERATVEAAEQANLPKFGAAVAQYQAEVQRRQGLARTELARLQDLQKSGQISPEEAEAQFDRWMKTNVEGPLAGYRAAAEEERRKQEQDNLTRQTAENARVEAANALRGRAGYEAGETAKAQALEVGLQTRSPEYIGQLGNFAQSLGQGKTNFQFDPSALDPAKFKAVQPDYDAIANQAMQRLFGLYPEAKAQNVNVPLPNLPTGQDLLGLMDGVKYSGPLSGTPTGETPLPGQEAIDLKNGKARTVYSNGRYVDWDINAPAPQLAQAGAAAPALPGLGGPDVAGPLPPFTPPDAVNAVNAGRLPGETDEQRRARFYGLQI